jgi:hypothetical protein
MSLKSDFDGAEWDLVAEGPVTAGMIVLTADSGGTFRETLALARSYTDARKEHGQSELLDEIVAAKPKVDHTRYHSFEELKDAGLQHLRTAVGLLEAKATADEVAEYQRFVLALANKVAAAHREHGQSVSPAEAVAIEQIADALGTKTS